MTEVVVKMRWEGHRLYIGSMNAGEVSRASSGEPWLAFTDLDLNLVVGWPSEAEARAAVEQAAIKALKGE